LLGGELPMSKCLWVLNRCVAPFFCGVCMAAATTVDTPVAVASLVGCAGVFAFVSLELGSGMIARITRTTA
jgi:hypothetical protein